MRRRATQRQLITIARIVTTVLVGIFLGLATVPLLVYLDIPVGAASAVLSTFLIVIILLRLGRLEERLRSLEEASK